MRRREFIALVGGAAVAEGRAWGQQPVIKQHRVAVVHAAVPVRMLAELAETGSYYAQFFAELRRLGHVEGLNLVIDRHSGEGLTEFTELAREVVRRTPDVIFTSGVGMAQALKEATNTIPIVALVSDPVAMGLAVSFSRPGGNLTGIVPDAGLEIWEKRFELLREVVPTVSPVVILPTTRDAWESHSYFRGVRQAGLNARVSLTFAAFNLPLQEAEYRRAFTTLRNERVGAIAVIDGPNTFVHRRLIVQLVQELRLPAIYPTRPFVEVGGLMACGAELGGLLRHAAGQVDQILKGTKPGEIPFFRATKYELVINLKTATALGLNMPPTLLARADEVIE